MGSPSGTELTQYLPMAEQGFTALIAGYNPDRPELTDAPVSFSVGMITAGENRVEVTSALIALSQYENCLQRADDPLIPRVHWYKWWPHVHGPYLDDGRNIVVEHFLERDDADYLVFIDSDVPPEPEQFYGLVAKAHHEDLAVLSGVYCNQYAGGIGPVAYHLTQDDEGLRRLELMSLKELNALTDDREIAQVAATGAGFLAVRRDVFVAIRDKFRSACPFFAEVEFDGIHLGEDLTFCLRAADVGFPVYCAPEFQVDHYKTCVIRPNSIED